MKDNLEIQTLIKNLKDLRFEDTLEKKLLQKRMIRQLYKLVGVPKEEYFPNEYRIAGRCWTKREGYTTWLGIMNKRTMEIENSAPTEWNIERPSQTKMEIVEEYTRDGWHCRVQAYNVMCYKYVKHPKIENLWVCFYSSRDCNKYEYVIELDENE